MSFINILSSEEEKIFNSIPRFNLQQQKYFFQLPKSIMNRVTSFENDSNKIIFILMYGYYKATNKFYDIHIFSNVDVEYVKKINDFTELDVPIASTRRVQQYQSLIKTYLGIEKYTEDIQNILQKEAINLANNFVHRKKIFYALVELSRKLKIEIPSYTELSKLITVALNTQKKDILNKLESLSESEKLKTLDEFLDKNEESKNRYNISYYRKLEHSTKKNQMVLSVNKLEQIKSKFIVTKSIIDEIRITPKIAEYYAKWIEKGKTSQLTQSNKLNQQFLLLCFIHFQYLIRNDNLIDRFISTVQTAKNSSFRDQKEFSFTQQPDKNRVMKSLEETISSTLNEITSVTKNKALNDAEKVSAIDRVVEKKKQILNEILSEKKVFETVAKNKYDFIEKKSISLQGKLSDVLKAIELDEENSNINIITAIKYFKNNPIITDKAPKEFLDDEEKKVIFEGGKFRISLYKIILFFHVSDAIKSGVLNLKYSYRYKHFDSYLMDKDEWDINKDELLKIHELEHLKDFDIFIDSIKTKVEENFKQTNENIRNEFNTYFTATTDSFILKTPKLEKDEDENQELIAQYLPHDEYLSVVDLLDVVDKEVDFLSSFQHHIQGKTKVQHSLLLGTILGYGCNLSLSKMGKTSKGINENQLESTRTWYFSEENTTEANDKIVAYMEKLEIVKLIKNNGFLLKKCG